MPPGLVSCVESVVQRLGEGSSKRVRIAECLNTDCCRPHTQDQDAARGVAQHRFADGAQQTAPDHPVVRAEDDE